MTTIGRKRKTADYDTTYDQKKDVKRQPAAAAAAAVASSSSSSSLSPLSSMVVQMDECVLAASSPSSHFQHIDSAEYLMNYMRKRPIAQWQPHDVQRILTFQPLLWINFELSFSMLTNDYYVSKKYSLAEQWIARQTCTPFVVEHYDPIFQEFSALGWCMFYLYNKCMHRNIRTEFVVRDSLLKWGETLPAQDFTTCIVYPEIQPEEQRNDFWSVYHSIVFNGSNQKQSQNKLMYSTMMAWQYGFFVLTLPHMVYMLRDVVYVSPCSEVRQELSLSLPTLPTELQQIVTLFLYNVPQKGSCLPLFVQNRLDEIFKILFEKMYEQSVQRSSLFDLLRLHFRFRAEANEDAVKLSNLVMEYCDFFSISCAAV